MASVNAIIVTSQRTGSTFLAEVLDAHPDVRCYGEVLNGSPVRPPPIVRDYKYAAKTYRYIVSGAWRPIATMERCYAHAEKPIVAFQAMYNRVNTRSVRRFLQERQDIRIIHLRRDNLLKQYVSRALLTKKRGASKERPWSPHTSSPVPAVSTRISPAKAIKEMRKVRDLFNEFESFFARHRKIELVYEQMINGQSLSSAAWAAVGELLEIEPAEAASDQIKINPGDLRPMVENYDELADALKGTEFERFLD
ncbi:MAG: sulfotransferase [Woeseiaceae bacterium]